MTVTIMAADAQGIRTEEHLFQEIPTAAARAFIRLIDSKSLLIDATIFLSEDDEDFAQNGEIATDIDPVDLKNVFGDIDALPADEQKIVTDFGLDHIRRAIELGQIVRISVDASWNKHRAIISTDGIVPNEPIMQACHCYAASAFAALGQNLPKMTESFTYKASDLVAGETVSNRFERDTNRLLRVAHYAIQRFGAEATITVV